MGNGCNSWQPTQGDSTMVSLWLHSSPLHFITWAAFFRCKSLHCICCVTARNPAVCWNLCFRKNSLYGT